MTALNPGGLNIAICHGHEKGKPSFVKKKSKNLQNADSWVSYFGISGSLKRPG